MSKGLGGFKDFIDGLQGTIAGYFKCTGQYSADSSVQIFWILRYVLHVFTRMNDQQVGDFFFNELCIHSARLRLKKYFCIRENPYEKACFLLYSSSHAAVLRCIGIA